MNRRGFLKALGVGAVILTVPIYSPAKQPKSVSPSLESGEMLNEHIVEIKAREEDFGHLLGVAYKLTGKDGELYREGVICDNWLENKKSEKGLMKMSKDVANHLGGWIDDHPQLNHYSRPSGEMVFNAIAGKFS